MSHPHPQLHDRPCVPQVVHCALQCTYYALLWQIVAATDRLPPQVGEGVEEVRRVSAAVCEEGTMERDGAGIAAVTGVHPTGGWRLSSWGPPGLLDSDVRADLGLWPTPPSSLPAGRAERGSDDL